jgi:Flp pilus assembly pilin Flp
MAAVFFSLWPQLRFCEKSGIPEMKRRMNMKSRMKRKEGQAMVEYIIIVAVVAIAALVIFGLFGDTIQKKLGGAVDELEGDDSGSSAVQSSQSHLEQLGDD